MATLSQVGLRCSGHWMSAPAAYKRIALLPYQGLRRPVAFNALLLNALRCEPVFLPVLAAIITANVPAT